VIDCGQIGHTALEAVDFLISDKDWVTTMAGYDAFDPRLESLVVETRTNWAPDTDSLSVEDKAIVARAMQRKPHLASKITYERTHTGFIREITVSEADIGKLYDQKTASGAL